MPASACIQVSGLDCVGLFLTILDSGLRRNDG